MNDLAASANEEQVKFLVKAEAYINEVLSENQRLQGKLAAVDQLKQYAADLQAEQAKRQRQLDDEHHARLRVILDKALAEHQQVIESVRLQLLENIPNKDLIKQLADRVEALAHENRKMKERICQAYREAHDFHWYKVTEPQSRIKQLLGEFINVS